ncbi:MAG: hypothetical protein LBR60_06395 [Fibrobacter sp.]|nr:hypothetical protein [Fibrobacter sp.]
MTETGFSALKPGRKYSTPDIIIVLFKSKLISSNNWNFRRTDPETVILNLFQNQDVLRINEVVLSCKVFQVCAVTWWGQIFRPEAAPICPEALKPCEHCVRQAEGAR